VPAARMDGGHWHEMGYSDLGLPRPRSCPGAPGSASPQMRDPSEFHSGTRRHTYPSSDVLGH